MRKIYDSPRVALEGLLFDGMTIMSGGFGSRDCPRARTQKSGPRA
ncbi:PcaI/PcaF/CatF [Sphingobium sp. TKS]|nr:PcaI/PcaF/CatF [Sphingobium sp. TKS]